ncbi:hypothetical protein [Kitasatospora sp. NPDC057223]|uniref:hypothetical protein n=1 Tax=Kitasatospora sp. NPDC057223 TaxID=3346055 RepID=UPI003635E7D6
MKRVLLAAAAALLLTATGCGSVHTAGSGPDAGASRSAQAEQAKQAAGEKAQQVLAEHDQHYPEVAKGCATATEPPSPSPAASVSVSLDPDAAKYAENHAYKQTAQLTAPARCRGDAHAARIRAALSARKAEDATGVQSVLVSLGYPKESIRVTASGGPAGFTLEVPGAGPCIEGRAGGGVLSVEAHGYYLEGGCTEPKGGH